MPLRFFFTAAVTDIATVHASATVAVAVAVTVTGNVTVAGAVAASVTGNVTVVAFVTVRFDVAVAATVHRYCTPILSPVLSPLRLMFSL